MSTSPITSTLLRRAALGLAALAVAFLTLAGPSLPWAGLGSATTAHAETLLQPADFVATPDFVATAEAQLLALVNADRAAAGLAPLAADPQLAAVARWRSEDMAARNYFSHDIGGYLVFQVIKERGIAYRVAGENLAFNTYPAAETVARAQAALMNSPTHRANILRPDFTHLGVGVALAPDGKVLYTQLFRQSQQSQ